MTGKEMRAFRTKRKLTQRAFGLRLGVAFPQIQISLMERGRRPINPRLQAALVLWKQNELLEKKIAKNGQ